LRGALIAIAAISALGLTNLIPRWSVSSALQMDVPSDGLQALCVIRNRPLPPQPTQPRSHRLRGPLSVKQAIGVVAGLGVAGLALRAIPGDAIYVYGGLAMQQLLDGRETSLKPSAQPDISPAKQRADEVMP
jgi:hypothetical protein